MSTRKVLDLENTKDSPEILEIFKGQKFLLFSVVGKGEDCRQKCDRGLFMKFRGAYADEKEAKEAGRKISELDNMFDIHIVEVGHWIPMPPPANIKEHAKYEYQNQELNKLLGSHFDNIERRKKEFEERKKSMLAKAKVSKETSKE